MSYILLGYMYISIYLSQWGMEQRGEWSSALKIHELYDHLLVMVFNHTFNMVSTWFPSYSPMRENMLKLINMGYLNNILNTKYSKSLYIILLSIAIANGMWLIM